MTTITMPIAVPDDAPITLANGEPLMLDGAPSTLNRIRKQAQLKYS